MKTERKSPDAQRLASKLDPALVIMDLRARDKAGVIAEAVDWLVKEGRLAERDQEEVVERFAARERQMTTGMLQCAFPEVQTRAVSTFLVVLSRSRRGVEFDALDKQPVRLFALTLCPPEEYLKNMKTMALLQRAMLSPPGDEVFLKKIDAAGTAEEVCDLLLARLETK